MTNEIEQFDLWDDPRVPRNKQQETQAKAMAFIATNPQWYLCFERLTFDELRGNNGPIGLAPIYYETRKRMGRVTNDFQPYFSRLFIIRNPKYADAYKIHSLFSRKKPADGKDMSYSNPETSLEEGVEKSLKQLNDQIFGTY
jgi:hypothetical protein